MIIFGLNQVQGYVALNRADIVTALRSDILRMEGIRPVNNSPIDLGLGSISQSFPGGSFPVGAVHEFLSGEEGSMASTQGFIAGFLSSLLGDKGTAVWISSFRNIFPPALKEFGVQPDHVVFVDVNNQKEIMWVMEEALKCGALTAVIGEMKDITFTQSRRLQLAVEQSQVTGFLVRPNESGLNTTACVSRWKITTLPSEIIEGLPGVGFPQWRVELLKIRNGRSGVWNLKWINGRFVHVTQANDNVIERRKVG